MNVEVCHFSTISNALVSIIHHLGLDNGGECGHLVSAPGCQVTDDETVASRGDGIVVNLSGGGEQLHWVVSCRCM